MQASQEGVGMDDIEAPPSPKHKQLGIPNWMIENRKIYTLDTFIQLAREIPR